jgi:hypothetical protein
MSRSVWLLTVVVMGVLQGGCALTGLSPFAYPRLWDYTRAKPAELSLSGVYRIRQVRTAGGDSATGLIQTFRTRTDVTVTVNRDGTATLLNIPAFDLSGEKMNCSFSGLAKWQLFGDGDWVIRFDAVHVTGPSDNVVQEPCGSQWNDGMNILGQAPPYRLWLGIGDPDNDTGIEFELADHQSAARTQ